MENKIKLEVEINLDAMKRTFEREAIERVVNDYFYANDIEDYVKKPLVRQERLKKIVDGVDWNKLPEEMQRNILGKFIEKMLKGF